MLSRKKAKAAEISYLTVDDELILSNIPVQECHSLIDEIYDSIGNCKECIYSFVGERSKKRFCCLLDDIIVKDSFFCARYKKRK